MSFGHDLISLQGFEMCVLIDILVLRRARYRADCFLSATQAFSPLSFPNSLALPKEVRMGEPDYLPAGSRVGFSGSLNILSQPSQPCPIAHPFFSDAGMSRCRRSCEPRDNSAGKLPTYQLFALYLHSFFLCLVSALLNLICPIS